MNPPPRVGLTELLESPRELARVRDLLSSGGVAAIPTETFYALAADPANERGVARIFEIKGRGERMPLLVLLASRPQLERVGLAVRPDLLDRFCEIWPAPLTVVLRLESPIPASRGSRSLAVRIPALAALRDLLERVGPLTGTSANRTGAPPLADPEEVAAELGSEIDLLIDGGRTPGGQPSTVIDAAREPAVVIRPGAFRWPPEEPGTAERRARLPGLMAVVREYAGKSPRVGARVYLAETAAVIGDVVLGDDVSVWYNSVVRGDCEFIRVGARTNIQDNCAVHTLEEYPTILEEEVTLGHGVIVHGAVVRRGALIGMHATVLNGADVGESALVGAGALVTPRTVVPPRTLWLGAPARQVKELSDAEVEDLKHFHLNYLRYKEEYFRVDGRWAEER